MATGILGLGSSGSNGLSQELIDKLKTAEGKSKIDPYTKKLESWDKELEKIQDVESKIKDLLTTMSNFDLYKSTANAFEQVTASTTGTSAVFNALDVSGLSAGTNSVTVTQLAQRDVYQSNGFGDKTVQIANGNDSGDKISIRIGGESETTFEFSTVGKTYQQLAEEINKNSQITASVEQVGDSSFKLVVKSKDSGTSNALTITQTGVDLGLSESSNKVLSAQNMKSTVDGIEYDVSSNTITIQGNLTMTAVSLGTSTISIQEDKSGITTGINDFVDKYNALSSLIDQEQFSEDSPISDIGSLKLVMGNIKNALFANYGVDEDKNVFNYGFSLDQYGKLSVDSTILGKAVSDDIDGLKSLFVGVAEKPGIGTYLKEYLDDLDGFDGLMTKYGETMANNKTKLEADKTKAQELLDSKYSLMSQQFASYTAMITQMEAAFGGLKMMIEQSAAGN